MAGKDETEAVDFKRSRELLRDYWESVEREAEENPNLKYVRDHSLREAIRDSINHRLVAYRFCLLIQLLGKLTNPAIDCLRLQKRKAGWDARSLGSKVVAPFNREQENVLGTSGDPYVGNPMRVPRMRVTIKARRTSPAGTPLSMFLSRWRKKATRTLQRMFFGKSCLRYSGASKCSALPTPFRPG